MDVKFIIVCAAFVFVAIYAVASFIQRPKDEKIENIKEWLKWAVTEAEKELGSGTGQLKLRKVYGMAVSQFPWIIQLISFDIFSTWVDEALEWMRKQIEDNASFQNYVDDKTEV